MKTNLVSSDKLSISEKDKILFYSQNIFFKEGFNKITINEIASGLMISKNTIYKHFRSKEVLLHEVIHNFLNKTQERIGKIVNFEENSVLKFISLLNFMGKTLSTISPYWMNDLKIHSPELWEKMDNFRKEKMYTFLSKIILQGQKEELVAEFPPSIIIEIFITSVRSIINPYFLTTHNFSYKEAIDSTFDILLNGILTTKGKKVYRNFSNHNYEIH
ncbi:MAG: TetR/AcrR family transcriptional regulator [Bacteroidetes bacterium]|nr:TetR/AcrR family transcriptional regulator [Bacteroidota bacterium]